MSESNQEVFEQVSTKLTPESLQNLTRPSGLLTLLALSSFAREQTVRFKELAERVNELQAPEPARVFRPALCAHYCRDLLARAGLVTLHASSVHSKESDAVQLNEQGWSHGTAIAGAHLGIGIDAPGVGFLDHVMGAKDYISRSNPRPILYRTLLRQPQSVSALVANTGLSQRIVSHHVKDLVKAGILTHKDLTDPDNQVYCIVAEPNVSRARGDEITQALTRIARKLYLSGQYEVTGAAFLSLIQGLYPAVPPQELWSILARFAHEPKRGTFLQPKVRHGRARSVIAIEDTYRPHIEKLLTSWQDIASDSEAAMVSRWHAQARSKEIMASPNLIKMLLQPYKLGSVAAIEEKDWLSKVEELVTAKNTSGIEMRALYDSFTSTYGYLGYEYFSRKLRQSKVLQISETRPVGRGGKKLKIIKVLDAPNKDVE